MDTIKFLLASFFEKFKLNNPKAYAALVVVLAGLIGAMETPQFAELTGSPDWLTKTIQGLLVVYALLTGTHTSDITGSKKKF